jgi:hypothetical protein
MHRLTIYKERAPLNRNSLSKQVGAIDPNRPLAKFGTEGLALLILWAGGSVNRPYLQNQLSPASICITFPP